MSMVRIFGVACVGLALLGAPLPAGAQDAEAQVYAAATTCAGVRSYLRNYPKGRFRELAEERIANECATAPRNNAAASSPARSPEPPADPCAQAKANWSDVSSSKDIPVLEAYMSVTPPACAIQRAQAKVRIDALTAEAQARARSQAAEQEQARQQAQAKADAATFKAQGGEFVGTWIENGPPCAQNSMNRYSIVGGRLKREFTDVNGNFKESDDNFTLQTADPPFAKESDGYTYRIENNRLRMIAPSGSLACEFKRR